MRPTQGSTFLALVCLAGPLVAADWAPIPASVWALKEDPAKGLRGAVVLESRIAFRGTYVEHRYRVRIMGESGRDAAEFREFSEHAHDLKGRTVYPDGRVVTFNAKKDFAQKSIRTGDGNEKRTLLVPPGVTGDCVVEVSWVESAAGRWTPLPADSPYFTAYTLAQRYPTLEMALEIPVSFPFAHAVFPSRALKPEVTTKGPFRIYTFRNVPAQEDVPFALNVTRDFPRFYAYFIPDFLTPFAAQAGPKFWKQAGISWYKEVYTDNVRKGGAYKALFQELWKDIKGTPMAEASALLSKLEGRIRNISYPTFSEAAAITKQQSEEEIRSEDLEATAKRGYTDSFGMTLLYLHLLQDRGLSPTLGFVADRDYHLFNINLPNVYQFAGTLVGVEEGDRGVLWVQPGRRFLQPGVIHQDYQGTPALRLDPKDWSAAETRIPTQPSRLNVRKFVLEVTPEGGEDRFTIQASFSGLPEYSERRRFMALGPKEQSKLLKEDLEYRLPSAVLSRTEVKGAQDPATQVSWEAEGRVEREEGRQRTVAPFPSVPYAIHIPDEWPAERKDPILMPYLRTQQAISTVHIPEGHTWTSAEPISFQNRFGSVQWTAQKQANGTVTVTLTVEITALFEAAASYGDLREFLGVVKEASNRILVFQKG